MSALLTINIVDAVVHIVSTLYLTWWFLRTLLVTKAAP